MALNEDWTNLAEHYDTFQRKAQWAQDSVSVGPMGWFTIIALLITAAIPSYLIWSVHRSFAQDNWTYAFGYMVPLGLSVYFFKHILKFVARLMFVLLVVGLLYWIGSCTTEAVSSKITRELTNTSSPN